MSPCGPAAWLRSGRLSKLPTTPACAGVAARQLENRPRRSSLRSTMAASPSGGRKAKMLSTSASQREAGDRHGFGNRLARSGLAWIMLALLEGRRAWQMAAMVWHRLPAALHKNGRTFVRQCSRDRSEGRACLTIREGRIAGGSGRRVAPASRRLSRGRLALRVLFLVDAAVLSG